MKPGEPAGHRLDVLRLELFIESGVVDKIIGQPFSLTLI